MKVKLALVILSLGLCGCGEQVIERYSTFQEVQKSGVITRGWVPDFLPSSAYDIITDYDLDTNDNVGSFRFDPKDAAAMVSSLKRIDTNAEIFKDQTGSVLYESDQWLLAVDVSHGRVQFKGKQTH